MIWPKFWCRYLGDELHQAVAVEAGSPNTAANIYASINRQRDVRLVYVSDGTKEVLCTAKRKQIQSPKTITFDDNPVIIGLKGLS